MGVDREVHWHELEDGARLPWLEFGPRGGLALVAMPGLTDGLAPISESAAALSVLQPPANFRPYRVIALSFRHPVRDGASTRDLARDLTAFLEEQVGRPAIVSGHSMGGMVAQHVAAERPDLVAGLILSATAAYADEALDRGLQRWETLLRAGDWRGFYRDAIDTSYTAGARLRRRLLQRLTPTPELPELLDRHLALSAAARAHDARPDLGRICAPTVVMAGEHDPLVRPQRSRELAEALPEAEFRLFPQLSHGFPEQARERYSDEVVAFVERVAM